MKNYERLIKLEEVLSDLTRNKTRQEWIDIYENEYFLSARTFREDLKQYNLALMDKTPKLTTYRRSELTTSRRTF